MNTYIFLRAYDLAAARPCWFAFNFGYSHLGASVLFPSFNTEHGIVLGCFTDLLCCIGLSGARSLLLFSCPILSDMYADT